MTDPRRDHYGRYLIIPAGGGKPRPYTRVTTFAATLDDRYQLEQWQIRMTAVGFATRPDLYAQLAATKPDDKQTLNKLCGQAKEAAAGSAGANLGNALHTFTQRVDSGETVAVPAPWDADIAVYRQTLDTQQIVVDPALIEQVVVLPEYGLAGTFDRIVTIGGKQYIADLKTGATLDFSWGSIAVQLACYAHAETIYNTTTETHTSLPQVDQQRALVIHLPAGKATCTLHWADIAAGWEAAEHAAWVRGWRKRSNLNIPWEHTPSPNNNQLRRTWLIDRIGWLANNHPGTLGVLAARWPANIPTFKASTEHTVEQLDMISAVLRDVEAAHHVVFPDTAEPGTDLASPADKRAVAKRVAQLHGSQQETVALQLAEQGIVLTRLHRQDLAAVNHIIDQQNILA